MSLSPEEDMRLVLELTTSAFEEMLGLNDNHMQYIDKALQNAGTPGLADITDPNQWCKLVQDDKATHVSTLLWLAIGYIQEQIRCARKMRKVYTNKPTRLYAPFADRTQAVLTYVINMRDFLVTAIEILQSKKISESA